MGICPSVATLFVAPRSEDRWFAVVDAAPLDDGDIDRLLDELPPDDVSTELDLDVAERAIAAFGMEWAAITGPVSHAMTGLLLTAPAGFGTEFMRWEPEELRHMRERNVAGGHASFVEAIRCLHRYRFASSLDIRPPLRPGD